MFDGLVKCLASPVLDSKLCEIQVMFSASDKIDLKAVGDCKELSNITALFVHPTPIGVNAIQSESVFWFLDLDLVAPWCIGLKVMGIERKRIPGWK
jgi:hypothetical protein